MTMRCDGGARNVRRRSNVTQTEMVLKHLKAGHALTQLEATIQFGIGRLAARIKELKLAGYLIVSEMIEVDKASGGKANVARYSMPEAMKQGGLEI